MRIVLPFIFHENVLRQFQECLCDLTNICLENAKDIPCRIAVPRHELCTGGAPAKSSDGSYGGSCLSAYRPHLLQGSATGHAHDYA